MMLTVEFIILFEMHRLAFVVPTKDRPDDLRKMLESLARQTKIPDQIIVVDGSAPDIRKVVDSFPELPLEYVRVFPPSLAKQRNAGMARIDPNITLAGYLDDDIVLEPNAVAAILEYWDQADPQLGGTVFNITNTALPRWTWIKSLLGLDHPTPGRLLKTGCTSILGNQDRDIETDWLCGGVTVWRREVIESYGYDEWFRGTGYLEDVDYSFNVRGKYRLALVANARLAHYSPPVRRDRHYLLGKWQIINRMYLVRKYRNRGLSPAAAWGASLGLTTLHLATAVAKADGIQWDQFRGNVAGMLSELAGRNEQLEGHLK
jgi:glycosyltransferase involved in cell wall biosynthesis